MCALHFSPGQKSSYRGQAGISAEVCLCLDGSCLCQFWPDHGLDCNAGIAQGLGLQGDYFETKAGGLTNAESSYWVTRVIHYPPLQEVGLSLSLTLS